MIVNGSLSRKLSLSMSKVTIRQVSALLTSYRFRLACIRIPFQSWDFAAENKVDNLLWQAHMDVNGVYRTVHKNFPSELVVKKRNFEKCYTTFISTSQLF